MAMMPITAPYRHFVKVFLMLYVSSRIACIDIHVLRIMYHL